MTKTDLVSSIAEKTGFTKADSARFVEAFQEAFTEGLNKEGKVVMTGFITAVKEHKAASTSRNPRTGEPVKVAAHNVAKIKAGSKLKEALN